METAMPSPPTPIDVLVEAVNALQAAKGNKSEAARMLKISRSNLKYRLENAAHRGVVAGQKPRVRVKVESTAAADPIARRSLMEESIALRRRIADLERQVAEERRWRGQFESMGILPDTSPWLSAPAVQKRSSHVMQLFTSDFQCGEKIEPREIDGINEYNQNVFVERYQTLIDKAIDLARNHTGATDFDGAVYLAGGDAISGEIHEELAETNDLSAVPAVKLLCAQEVEGIRRLRDAFGHVKVYRVSGNHGRTTRKPRSKGYTDHNYETLLSWWLASRFENDPKVQFFVPASGDAYYDVLGWKFLMSHGDRMGSRGGMGFIGPAATIARGHAKLYNNYTATGRPVDWILTGHLHTELKLERGFGNGALAGYSEFARDLRATPDAARQWMFLTHKSRPIAQQFSIQLSEMPRRVEMPE